MIERTVISGKWEKESCSQMKTSHTCELKLFLFIRKKEPKNATSAVSGLKERKGGDPSDRGQLYVDVIEAERCKDKEGKCGCAVATCRQGNGAGHRFPTSCIISQHVTGSITKLGLCMVKVSQKLVCWTERKRKECMSSKDSFGSTIRSHL